MEYLSAKFVLKLFILKTKFQFNLNKKYDKKL